MREYIRFIGYLRDIFESYTDQVESFGLDECWLDVTGSGIFGNSMAIAPKIAAHVKFELGITVSIGIANNKVTAKLGSDYKRDRIARGRGMRVPWFLLFRRISASPLNLA